MAVVEKVVHVAVVVVILWRWWPATLDDGGGACMVEQRSDITLGITITFNTR